MTSLILPIEGAFVPLIYLTPDPLRRTNFIFVVILVCFPFLKNYGQQVANYVANGNFEEIYSCQGPFFPVSTAKYWNSLDSFCFGALFASICNNSVPLNGTTYQFPRSGNAFVITTLYYLYGNRGHIKNKLKENLRSGKSYCVKFYVNITNNSPRGMNGFGAFFGDQSIDTIKKCGKPLNYINPQVKNPIGNVISDTLNWVPITGTFVATGNEKYLVLGNFLADNAVITAPIYSPYYPEYWTDVCFDDVSCIEMDASAYAGPDTLIYFGDSAFIGRQPDYAIDPGCIWYKLPNMTNAIDTISGLWVKPSVTSKYVVRQELECSSLKWDTVVVTVSHNLIGVKKLEMLNDELEMFPQPANEILELRISNQSLFEGIHSILITDNLGQMVREEEIVFETNSKKIDVSGLPNGIYFVELRSDFGVVRRKFVKGE